jgi:hypothetical protein
MYLGLEDKGSVFSILKNWPERRVKAICLTDGQRVGGLGDLGVQVRRLRLRASMQQREPMMVMEARRVRCLSMRPPAVVQAIGVPISRLALYTACGGVVPSACLPITIDAGTDNESLLQDPIYVGTKHRRVRGDAYHELVEELLVAVRRRYGTSVMVDLAGMDYETQSKLINTYRGTFPMYSDSGGGRSRGAGGCTEGSGRGGTGNACWTGWNRRELPAHLHAALSLTLRSHSQWALLTLPLSPLPLQPQCLGCPPRCWRQCMRRWPPPAARLLASASCW